MTGEGFLFLKVLEKILRFVFLRGLRNGKDFCLHCLLSKADLDDIPLLHVVGGFDDLVVHQDPACVARFVGYRAAFDQA